MSASTPLTKDLVKEPGYCRLDMRIGMNGFDVMVYNPLEDNSLILRHCDLPTDDGEALKRMEAFIYDNPLLLSDFKTITAIIESDRFMTVPTIVADSCDSMALLSEADSDTDRRATVIEDDLTLFDARILTTFASSTANFMRRTFPNIRIHNALYPFTRYCHANLTKGNTVKAFINLRSKSLDIALMSSNTLHLLNRFEYRDINDAAYYILNCTEDMSCELSEVLIGGDRIKRDELMPLLRKFRPYVMPMIFPSAMFKAGPEAMQAPFDLIILPLCE